MDCKEINELLLGMEDLSVVSTPGVVSHLHGCRECRGLLVRLRRLEQAAKAIPATPESAAAKEAFLRRLKVAPRSHGRFVSWAAPRWRPAAIAASLLLCAAGVMWLLIQGAADTAMASDTTVDRLVDWNLKLTDISSPAERNRMVQQQADAMKRALDQEHLSPEERELGLVLLENGKWLATHTDPLEEAERFQALAGRILKQVQKAARAGHSARAARQAKRYELLMSRGAEHQLSKAVTLDNLERKRWYKRLVKNHAALADELQQIVEQSPDLSRKAIRKQLGLKPAPRGKKPAGKSGQR